MVSYAIHMPKMLYNERGKQNRILLSMVLERVNDFVFIFHEFWLNFRFILRREAMRLQIFLACLKVAISFTYYAYVTVSLYIIIVELSL